MNLFLLLQVVLGRRKHTDPTDKPAQQAHFLEQVQIFFTRYHLSKTSHFTRYQYLQDSRFQTTQILQDTGLQARGCDLVEDQCWGRLIDVASRRRTLSVIQPSTEPSLLAHIESRTWELIFPCRPPHCRPPWSPPPSTTSLTNNTSTSLLSTPQLSTLPFFLVGHTVTHQQHHLHQQHNLNQQRHFSSYRDTSW